MRGGAGQGDVLSALGRADLRGAEARAAAYVRAHVEEIAQTSIASLARAAGVSEPTIVRLCRRLGCTGFPDLKLRLARGLASGTPYVHRDVAIDDPLPVIIDKVLGSTLRAIADCQGWIDRAAFAAAVEVLHGARRVDCFGVGLATAWALDAQIKLTRLGIPTIWHPDGQSQAMAASGLRAGDVVLVLTVRGSARDLIHAARLARANGAKVVGVARPGAPLARHCDVFLPLDVVENTAIYTPSQSQLLVFLFVDLLLTALICRRGPTIVQRLRDAKQSVEAAHEGAGRTRRRRPG